MPTILILGIDPGLALKKPMAMALVEFPERRLLTWCETRVGMRYVESRIRQWTTMLGIMLSIARDEFEREVDMVAIEDVRARGKGGAHMQTLVTFLKERAEGHGIRVELVNPSSVKLHATGYGASPTGDVAAIVRAEYKGASRLPPTPLEYDLEMAVAIAGGGYAKLQKEAREKLADGDN